MLHLWSELNDGEHVYVRRDGDKLYVQVTSREETVHEFAPRRDVQASTFDVVGAKIRALLQRARMKKG
jgi:hypothetical protein